VKDHCCRALGPVHFLSPDQQSGIHCLIICAIQLFTLNNLGGTWRRICSPDIRNIGASEFYVIALNKSALTYLLTYLLVLRVFVCWAMDSNVLGLHFTHIAKFQTAVAKPFRQKGQVHPTLIQPGQNCAKFRLNFSKCSDIFLSADQLCPQLSNPGCTTVWQSFRVLTTCRA